MRNSVAGYCYVCGVKVKKRSKFAYVTKTNALTDSDTIVVCAKHIPDSTKVSGVDIMNAEPVCLLDE